MKPTKKDRTLGLSRESLRPLTEGVLQVVRGGGTEGASVKTGECRLPPDPVA